MKELDKLKKELTTLVKDDLKHRGGSLQLRAQVRAKVQAIVDMAGNLPTEPPPIPLTAQAEDDPLCT